MQYACAILSSVAWPTMQYFSTLFQKRKYFRKKMSHWTLNVRVYFLYTVVWNIFHYKKKWARYDKKCILVYMWSARYSCPILKKLVISRQIFEKICRHQISWISVQLEPSCSMRTDGQKNMTQLLVAFRNCAKVPKTISLRTGWTYKQHSTSLEGPMKIEQ
jgi:hypothetical protein